MTRPERVSQRCSNGIRCKAEANYRGGVFLRHGGEFSEGFHPRIAIFAEELDCPRTDVFIVESERTCQRSFVIWMRVSFFAFFVIAAIHVVVVLHHPDSTFAIEGEGDRFADVGFGSVDGNLEAFFDLHFGDGLLRGEKWRIAGLLKPGAEMSSKQAKSCLAGMNFMAWRQRVQWFGGI